MHRHTLTSAPLRVPPLKGFLTSNISVASITPLMILMFALGTTGELFMPYRVEITNMQSYKNQSVKSLHRINPLWLRVVGGHQNIDGNYTPSLRAAQNVSWKSHMTNQRLNNALPRISTTFRNRRLALAGHVMRHNEVAREVLLWQPDDKRRIGRPSLAIKNIGYGVQIVAKFNNKNRSQLQHFFF